jgi:tight adherence protein B
LPLSPEAAFLLSLLVGCLLGGILFLWREQLVLAACGMGIGMVVVMLYLVVLRNRRSRAFLEQLPEAVSLLSRSVHAGESLEQAMRTVAQHTADPLAGEFRQCAMQFDMGLSVESTMRALIRRVPLAEMQILASTLIVQRRAGGHLAETLDTLVRVIRDRLNYQRHFRATTAAARLSALLIGIGGPLIAVAIWTWQPQYLRLLTSSPEGRTLLVIAFVLYLVGLVWALRLLRPKY